MCNDGLKTLETISQAVGNSADYIQGGGGNTSVKLNDELMAVKASGFKLKQITPEEGYVIVNYKNIISYYENVDLKSDTDFEKESVEFVKNNVIEAEGLKKLRPSVEAGFHSILKKCVIHTHPVYANILCCTKEGRETVEKIFKGQDFEIIWIPYINPGFCLTLRIKEEIAKCIKKTGKFPEVVFMENHGLIATSDDSSKCIQLHNKANDMIKEYLGIKVDFPSIELDKKNEETFVSKTKYIADFLKTNNIESDFFDTIVLYPDQLVYLNGSVCVNGMKNKLNINTDTGEIIYKTNYSEALTIEETLLAYIFVVNEIRKSGLTLKTMSDKDIDFIKNWESEAYRKNLVKSLKV